ncbi:MAG: IS66 family transposase, partial [Chloroflexi bacterium]|nr:IS66 family transposase [Chloroflexota bacterium]
MRLRAEVAALRTVIKQLEAEVARLQAENRQLQAENAQLRGENAHLREEKGQLEEEVAKREKEKRGAPAFVKANRVKKEKQPRKKRAAEQNKGRRREAATRHEKHTIDTCPVCGEALVGGSVYYRRQVVDIPPPQAVEVVEHEIEKRWCRRCRQWRWPAVDWSGVVLGNSRIGVRLMGLVVYLRLVLRVPIEVIQQYVASLHQVKLSQGEISDICQRVSQRLQPAGEHLLAEARASPVAHMDETGWREDGRNGYSWCLATDGPTAVRYYRYRPSRSHLVAEELLGDFGGHLVSDFYNAYNSYTGAHQRCWVHLLRDLHELRQAYPENSEVVAWVLAVKWLYRQAQTLLAGNPSPQERTQLYDRLWEVARQLGLQYAQTNHPCRPLAKRLLRHLDELFQFVLYSHVPADNNLAERALRSLVVQRKISGGTRSPAGSQTRMALASLFETWKARGFNPLFECWRHLG